MTLVFTTEHRFEKLADGNIYSITGLYSLKFWQRYLEKFDKIVVIARVAEVENVYSESFLANSRSVYFIPLPYYIGLGAFLKKRSIIKKILTEQAIVGRSYLCRVPGVLGYMMSDILKEKGIRYGLEVVGDPWDVFSMKSFMFCLAPLLKIYSYFSLRRIVCNASAVLYVTKEKLQKRYPAANGVFTTNASNVDLPDNHIFKSNIRSIQTGQKKFIILSVGYLNQMYKAPDVAIDAIDLLKMRGLHCELIWLGDGLYKDCMIRYATDKGLSDRVNFVGNVLSDNVRDYLLACDIFILISRTEGLPRSLIEAMGAGLPCIGTRVGGIPELLDKRVLVRPDNAKAVADMIEILIRDKDFAKAQAQRNFEEAAQFRDSLLKERRENFYDTLIQILK